MHRAIGGLAVVAAAVLGAREGSAVTPASVTPTPPVGAGTAPVVWLWPDGAPGSEARKRVPETPVNGNLAGIHNPSLTVFLPDAGHATGDAVVILPGGGHRFLVMEKEGFTIARWLAAHGVAGFVLKYRLAREPGSTYRVEVESLHDVQRALRLVRSRAAEWKIDPARVGVMGFSAGGELAALAAMRFDAGTPGATDAVERQSARPAFQALVYPAAASSIAPVKDSPPAFLVAGHGDRPDISEGVARAYLALHAGGVSAELHVYAGVGHGFALRPGPADGWIARFADWLAERAAAPAPDPKVTVSRSPEPAR
jgi:endo-1,4-beta-xylanase